MKNKPPRIQFLSLLFCLIFPFLIHAQITLSHNVGSTPINTGWEPCEDRESWGRMFTLSEFGVSTSEQLIIRSGQVAISNSYEGAKIYMNIYSVNSEYPNWNLQKIGVGGGAIAPEIGDTPQIVEIEFFQPLVVPSGVEKILVSVYQGDDIYNPDFNRVVIAGTEQDNDTSYVTRCNGVNRWTPTEDLDNPVPDANFYINVTGEKLSIINSSDHLFLSHNVGDDVKKTIMFSCSSCYQYWARKFVLEDFNIGENEELIINKGQVGISMSGWSPTIQFNIYEIDEDFPASFSESDLIGSSQTKPVPSFSHTDDTAYIVMLDFETPVVIPSDVTMILVEVHKGIDYGSALAFVAGTEETTDSSWYRGVGGSNNYTTMADIDSEPPNFYITVNGDIGSILPFQIVNSNNCINFSNDLSLTNPSEIDTVIWNFDDPDSGVNNASTTINTNHQFTAPGIYQVSANVQHINGTSYTITKEIEIFEAPIINETVSLKQCDNSDINGFSFFNLEEVKSKIIANPENYTITFFEERTLAESNALNSIQNTTSYSNELVSNDVIWARVEDTNGCFSISKIQLIVSTTEIPLSFKKSFHECDDGLFSTDGIATFNFSSVTQEVFDLFPPGQQLIINYYESEADALAEVNEITNISNYQNTNSPTQQTIYIRVDSAVNNDCLGLGPHIILNVDRVPIANPVIFTPECDNDRDGLFMFNSSTIQNTIVGNQTGVEVRYYDESGNPLPSPLPNPFASASQTITARITNSNSQDLDGQCYDETQIEFIVNSVPVANQVPVQEVCDDDLDGVVGFDTSTIETTILGVQTDLIVKYYDGNNNALPSPLPNPFYTTSQTISVRLENPNYDVCYEETTIDFRVREKPIFDLAEKATICMTNTPELTIAVENPNGYHSYTWKDENNTTISSFSDVTLTRGGVYKVFATSIFGCTSIEKEIIIEESSKAMITIEDIEVIDDTNNNSIKVNTSNLGLGAYEFQLLDDNSTIISDYQNTPFFDNLEGGVYTLVVNDIKGCGAVSFDVSLLSFPKFFTPNEDGINDYWKIKGISRNFYQSGNVSIFNRYGKLISKHNIDDIGWNGTYNGKILTSNNYWFYAELVDVNGKLRTRSGNFSLLRN